MGTIRYTWVNSGASRVFHVKQCRAASCAEVPSAPSLCRNRSEHSSHILSTACGLPVGLAPALLGVEQSEDSFQVLAISEPDGDAAIAAHLAHLNLGSQAI